MAEKKSDSDVRKEFDAFLETCPSDDAGDPRASVLAVGQVMRSSKSGRFVLRTQDNALHDIPNDAVENFTVMSGDPGARVAQLSLNADKLGAEAAGDLRQAGQLKNPAVETLKEPPADKNPPFDTLKEPLSDKRPFDDKPPQVDKIPTFDKNPPFDKIPPIDKNPPFDTFKEPIFDTLKEPTDDKLPTFDKNPPFDTLKELPGDGTGIADTLVETFPTAPGGGVVQPQAAMAAAAPRMAQASPFAGAGGIPAQIATSPTTDHFTLKEIIADPGPTFKEVTKDPSDDPILTWKEITKDGFGDPMPKAPIADPITGLADTWVESTFGTGFGPAGQPGLQQQTMAPFILATAHQAPQGAVAQQFLAGQAAQGTIGRF